KECLYCEIDERGHLGADGGCRHQRPMGITSEFGTSIFLVPEPCGSAMLLKFFFLTFLFSWLLFAAVAATLHSAGDIPSATGPAGLLFISGALIPLLVAVRFPARASARRGALSLLTGVHRWPADFLLVGVAV